MDRKGKLSLGQLPEITTLEIQERDGRSDGELKVSEALARTCEKVPGRGGKLAQGPAQTLHQSVLGWCPGLGPRTSW